MTKNNIKDSTLDYHSLNAMLNILDENGDVQFDADKAAVRKYFIDFVNKNTVFFYDLDEKLKYLVDEGYYEKEVLEQYSNDQLHSIWKKAIDFKFRFETFLGAYKFFSSYALKTRDGKRFLERFEDRVVMNALTLARGDFDYANDLLIEILSGRFQPATPTFLNCGKKSRGELISCFLLRVEDNMESIGRAVNSSLQLSRRGGGVALNLTNLRELGAPIKGIENQSSGVIPVMKMLEDAFSYANQLGSRQGAGAAYLNAHHPDILNFLDTKRENADEKIRIKTLSLGLVIPDVTFQLAKENKEMYLFSPYDVERVYGKPMSDISITEHYEEMVDNPNIRKSKINARELFLTIAEVQFESGYPYIMFEDTVNRLHNVDGRVSMSNLCSEILQASDESTYNDDLSFDKMGTDISCNLGSLNIAKAMDGKDFKTTVGSAIRALTSVSEMSAIDSVPSIRKGNDESHAIGLGQMNLHGFLARENIHYGSEEGLDFTNVYFYNVLYHCLLASNEIAKERGETFKGFEKSKYADGSFFAEYINNPLVIETEKVQSLFKDIELPTVEDWKKLAESVQKYGIFNKYLQAVPPTGSISYINNSTASIHPITSKIEIRKEGKLGRVYYPAPFLNKENGEYYRDAYDIGPEAIIDTYAIATKYVDQGLSLTLFFKDGITTRDINKAQIYAWKKGIKTLYYIRMRQEALDGTQVEGCVSCSL